jgi:DNA-binding NarL/FixJ family response regulator
MTASTAPLIRVLILDDHPVVRFGIAAIVASQPDMEVIGQASRGREAIEIYREHHPDVTLIDLRLPDISGVQVIRSIRSLNKDAKLMVITTYDGDEDIFQAIRAGAAGYIIKGMSHEILLDGIRQVMSGRHYVPKEIATKLDTRNPMATLSEREHQVLRQEQQGDCQRPGAHRSHCEGLRKRDSCAPGCGRPDASRGGSAQTRTSPFVGVQGKYNQ